MLGAGYFNSSVVRVRAIKVIEIEQKYIVFQFQCGAIEGGRSSRSG